ncbi:hypothetical protein COV49_01645 [Candidatus Falkowbacteria bacterium CG11_big_fil_rev_8_21_14_0_20_39_10]|uniref:Type II secretion system protein GspF domain-containing protein n=1 Tax=Candidatus Falkowbacteria bacterium CG11_big_fil_rev_8_21_14_0_20_39_10 TaxID=1974570 RepID=A0A2M6K9J8_9BACT|nr:MAG: hypothetical protein COV49_01645 [Candidatus Falkowbacteria bacterium CG11_big_fil_rev_8_21_14_0_20_39_10]
MPKKIKPIKKSVLEQDINIGGTGLAQTVAFAKHLSIMLKSGLTITEALGISLEGSQGRFKKIVGGVLNSVEAGNPFSKALSVYPGVFSNLFVSAIYAGESSGTLEENLENLAEQLKKEKELRSKIKGAMIYPILVMTAALVLGLGMAFLVLPKITPLLEGLRIELPFTTRALIWFSHLIESWGLVLFIGLAVFIAGIIWTVRQKFSHPATHWLFLNIPIIKSISRYSNLAHICRTLGALLKSGLNIDEALKITTNSTGNYYYQKSLEKIGERTSRGAGLSENFSQFEKLYPTMVIKMIKVGEKSGRLDETLVYLSDYYELEAENNAKTLSTAIEPILLLFIGLTVAFLALSIITPIYNITGGIRR